MALSTGAQLRAARALAGLEQAQIAAAAGIAANTVYRLERTRGRFEGVKVDTVHRLQLALEDAGVEFIDSRDVIGVQMRRSPA